MVLKGTTALYLVKSPRGRILYRLCKLVVWLSEERVRWSIPAEDSAMRRRLLRALGLKLAKPVFLDVGFSFECGHNIEIGPYTFLRQNAYLGDWDRISIGAGTSVGRSFSVYTGYHDRKDLSPRIAPVTIGNYCWIAAEVTVLPGVTIGDNCIIGARSLVARDIPDDSIACGVPARIADRRSEIPENVYTGFGFINRATRTLAGPSAPR